MQSEDSEAGEAGRGGVTPVRPAAAARPALLQLGTFLLRRAAPVHLVRRLSLQLIRY